MIKTITLKVNGMFCPNCEQKIANALSEINGIAGVRVSYKSSIADIEYNEDLVSLKEIKKVICDTGYEISGDTKNPINMQNIYILIIAAALYIILKRFGVLNIFRVFPSIQEGMSYGMLFLIGLLTSVHCIAMCGGINLSQSVSSVKNGGGVIKSNLLYNSGRVISYTVIGGIVGAIGAVISFGGGLRGIAAIIAGIFMIIMGANMLGLFRFLQIRIPAGIAAPLNRLKHGKSSFIVGLLNGFIPCGPLQTMQLYALYTGSFLGGALSMFLFSIGTVPLMLLFGTVSGRLNKRFASKLLAVSAVLIVVLGIGMLGNGLNLSGIQFNSGASTQENIAVVSDGYQTVTTEIDYGSYEPITVKKGIPVRWTIVVPEGKLNGCNGEIIIPKYNVDVKLHEGDNLIEFTPEEIGTVGYSCWMGMIKSTIEVTD